MKHLNKILLIGLIFCFGKIFGQAGSTDTKGVRMFLDDSTKAVPSTQGALFYFKQATGDKWRIWNNGLKYKLSEYSSGGGSGSTDTFGADVTFTLLPNYTLGKYKNGDVAHWAGLTAVQALQDAAVAYIPPVFNSFSISGQATTVEVGTTLTGSKIFLWSITNNSGSVPTIDIYNNTASSTLLAGTPNDGTQSTTISTVLLNSNGAAQSWKGIGNNVSPSGTFNSGNFVVTARFYRFYGPSSSSVSTSANVRALPTSEFQTGPTTFNLNTGTSLTKFIVALPPSVTITQVIDLDALNADITGTYVFQGTILVLDAGATTRSYNIYEMNLGGAYSINHRHAITTN